jgi:hypothetical protein
VARIEAQARQKDPFPLRMANQLYRNLGGRFEDVSGQAGAAFAEPHVSRGAAFGDIDNDGDTDVVIGNASGPLQLLVNEIGTRQHWLGLRLVGTTGRRDTLGARIAVERQGATTLWRRARSDGSYASSNDPRVLVGLGSSTTAPRVRVEWPDGSAEEWTDLPFDRWTTLEAGTGKARTGRAPVADEMVK